MPNKNNYLKYSSLGFQMAITIGLAAWGGQYLDNKYQLENPIWTIVLILFGIGIALYQVIREVTKLSNDNTKPSDKSTPNETK